MTSTITPRADAGVRRAAGTASPSDNKSRSHSQPGPPHFCARSAVILTVPPWTDKQSHGNRSDGEQTFSGGSIQVLPRTVNGCDPNMKHSAPLGPYATLNVIVATTSPADLGGRRCLC